ncbi:hypothetical protein [Nocardioides yefusunii]|uniref:Uncharacterized protein n=1 Tax=Nocardioides yefusunii TaxID=2500546 RepID=A0ABW1QYS3_9ACTN|nr:hypothetical protein [Nocardioides yefusunii]
MFQIHTAEWGPDRHNPESPWSHDSLESFRDQRDAGDQRPDDN